MKYKCYVARIDDIPYYFYMCNKNVYVYGNKKHVTERAMKSSELDRLANILLISITDLRIHLRFNGNIEIYGARDTFYDLEE